MEVQRRNDATIYCLSSGPVIPEWLGDRARRNLSKRDESIRRRIELIQDFAMPSSSSKIVQSSNGRYIFAAGTYPPRIRCFDVHELTMKFERYTDSHVADLTMLSEDYGKLALLLDDRTVALHAPYGAHESIRIPTFGRAMAYEPTTCELLIAAKGNQLYRLNLEEGRFCEPWTFEPSSASSTCISVSPTHPMAAVGGDDGIVRFWDNRSSDAMLKPFLSLDVQSATAGYGYADSASLYNSRNPGEITSVAHDSSGLYMAAGTAGGLVALYDVRSSKPLCIQEHKLGMPINTVKFHNGSSTVLSCDEKLVKIWRYKPSAALDNSNNDAKDPEGAVGVGSVVANVEGTGKFNNFIVAGDENDPNGHNSGVILCATEQPKMDSYYIPALGLAPKWCSFLDSITEELEERDLTKEGASSGSDLVRDGHESIYENYKFVSRDEVEKLGISNLVGTPLLRGYMHGFFMDIQLYNKVRAVANPFEYEEYRKKKLKERVEAKQASRIAPKQSSKKKASKLAVNAEFGERLIEKADKRTKAGHAANQVLADDRFSGLFTNPDYHIDEDDINFKLRNPSGVADTKKNRSDDMDSDQEDESEIEDAADPVGFNRVDSDEDSGSDNDHYDSESDEDGFRGSNVRGEMYDNMKKMEQESKKSKKNKKASEKKKKSKKAIMFEAENYGDGDNTALDIALGDGSASARAKRKNREFSMPLEQRLKMKQAESEGADVAAKIRIGGDGVSREMTYIPKDTRKKMENAKKQGDDDNSGSRRKRRGVKDLGFKKPFMNKSYRWVRMST